MINRFKTLFLVLIGLAAWPSAQAAPILQFDQLPETIAPGQNVSFEVLLTADDLNSYNVELLLSATVGTPGTDYYFVSATQATSGYVFASKDEHRFMESIQSGATLDRLTLSDFLLSDQIDAQAGVNDRLARVIIGTSASFKGALTLKVNSDSLELFNADLEDVPGASNAVLPMREILTPEPAMALIFLLAPIAMARRRRRA